MKKKKNEQHLSWCCWSSGRGFAIFLIILGGFFLLRDLGILPKVSFWPLVLIAFGIYLLARKNTC